jgi:16S rRNA A1518/A1519 N6-dimethyltransferase RsmA/KsgA/DIM1 with predicted DNA glycosylase/AP lyase activity
MRDALPADVDLELLRAVVRGTFGKRRKTLRNSLRYLADAGTVPAASLPGSPVPLDLRPEQLSPEDFISLARHIATYR